jgi:type VI secretion system protein ImpH
MAAASREKSIDLTPTIFEEPWPIGFFQAARMLQLSSAGDPVGRHGAFAAESVRFAASTDPAFPASEIQSIDRPAEGAPLVRVNIMGLTGPMGVLPLAYTAFLRERERAGDVAGRDFLDLFHHRLLSLFYRAWERQRCGIAWERGGSDPVAHLADLIGLATPGLANRQEIPDNALLFYAGLLSIGTRPASALEQMIADHFGVPVEIEQFVGAWQPIDVADQSALGGHQPSEQLGMGALAGSDIWDRQSRIRLRLGPLSIEEYRDFLPGGVANRRLRALTAFYAGIEFDIETQLILRRDEVPECELRDGPEEGARLGWTTWVKSEALTRDPDDTILEFAQAA